MSVRRLLTSFAVHVASVAVVSLAYADDARYPTTATADVPVQMTVHADKVTARVAEPIQLVIEVDAPRNTRIDLPINRPDDR